MVNLSYLAIGGRSLTLFVERQHKKVIPLINFCCDAYDKRDLNLRILVVNYCILRQLSVNKRAVSKNDSSFFAGNAIYEHSHATLQKWMKAMDVDIDGDTMGDSYPIETIVNIGTHNDDDEEKKERYKMNQNMNDNVELLIKTNNTYNNYKVNNKGRIYSEKKDIKTIDIEEELSLKHFRDDYDFSFIDVFLSNVRQMILECYKFIIRPELLQCFQHRQMYTVKASNRKTTPLAVHRFDEPRQNICCQLWHRLGKLILSPLYAITCVISVVFPILCLVLFIVIQLIDNNNNKGSNELQICLSAIYIIGIVSLCVLIPKVHRYYHILWHLSYCNYYAVCYSHDFFFMVQSKGDMVNATFIPVVTMPTYTKGQMLHIRYVYCNMYEKLFTICILKQFFGVIASVVIDFVGLSLDKREIWDMKTNDKGTRLIMAENIYDDMIDKANKNETVNSDTIAKVQALQLYLSRNNGKITRKTLNAFLGFDKYIMDYATN